MGRKVGKEMKKFANGDTKLNLEILQHTIEMFFFSRGKSSTALYNITIDPYFYRFLLLRWVMANTEVISAVLIRSQFSLQLLYLRSCYVSLLYPKDVFIWRLVRNLTSRNLYVCST